jgi:hypothetical protein
VRLLLILSRAGSIAQQAIRLRIRTIDFMVILILNYINYQKNNNPANDRLHA